MHNNQWILVADGGQANVLAVTKDAEGSHLEIVHEMSADNRPSHEIASDKPGRGFANPGGNQQRHAMPPSTDPHRHAQDEFVADVVNWLTDKRNHNRFENLVVIAPPRIMGEMRNKMPKPLAETVEGEITKDLTNIPVHELPRHLSGTAGWL
ncbi:host attachment protein [Thalassospira marina]|uniref:Host attachment protein n=1 Tax=Thalassospira marina TaxID=2048283 RepID=A0A2N3KGP2_9PROT|nr:host attachment protein [Thalassospira marina]AUG53163.1 Host attachment protein [Thalassospira marina]PKR49623.1 Host attachment protein [Thalassospira marina]